ncbi:MAG TPA: hypothetical protein VGC39_07750 [Candidatus Methylacidiphilales bacterium]
MKIVKIAKLLAVLALAVLGAGRVLADTTETKVDGKVVNSTYSFTNCGTSGPGNFSLDQTTMTNLNSVTLQLVIKSITYTVASVTGTGGTPTISFDLAPTLGNAGSNLPETKVTLTASGPIAKGVVETNVVFTLTTPVVFAYVLETNPGNTNKGTGTWQESLSNLEPTPDMITTANGIFWPNSVQNNDFDYCGSVEVQYAPLPEPSSWLLGVIALGTFFVLYRRYVTPGLAEPLVAS